MLLCEKCGRPITGPAGRCVHCDPPLDATRSPACAFCTAPLVVDSFGAIICTGCNRSEHLCGCGPSGFKQGSEPVNGVGVHGPKAQWWFERLQRLVALQRGATGLNRAGDFLVKFALYSTFVDLATAAMHENKKEVYEAAVRMLRGEEGT